MDVDVLTGGLAVGLAVWLAAVGAAAIWRSFKRIANG